MIETPEITVTPAQETAVIRLKIPPAEMRNAVPPAIGELMGAVGAQGIGPAGPLYMRYFSMEPEAFEFDVGVPVNAPVAPAGRVTAGQLPAVRVARAVFQGDYAGLHGAWSELESWIKGAGCTSAPGFWESYLAGPESSPDPATWRTQLNRPLSV
jgi:effector-binding domain-containing protein